VYKRSSSDGKIWQTEKIVSDGKVEKMDTFIYLSWGSPIGLGVFLAGFGVFLWGLTKTGWISDSED